MPLRLMVCGLPEALSVMLMVATRAPVVVGVKVTLKTQVAFGASVVTQLAGVVEEAKSPGLVPPRLIALMVSGPVPVLVSVTVWAALVVPTKRLPKLRLVLGVKVTAGAMPVPLRLMVWGLPLALSVMLMVAARAPVTLGVKVTLKTQVAFTASVVTQLAGVVEEAKSPGLVPPRVMAEIVSGPVPVFVSVTVCAPLVVLTS